MLHWNRWLHGRCAAIQQVWTQRIEALLDASHIPACCVTALVRQDQHIGGNEHAQWMINGIRLALRRGVTRRALRGVDGWRLVTGGRGVVGEWLGGVDVGT